jgi:hypothetical protein
VIQSTFAFGALQLAVIFLAAKLWLDLRRDQRRRRLLRNVELTLNHRNQQPVRPEDLEQLKRAA